MDGHTDPLPTTARTRGGGGGGGIALREPQKCGKTAENCGKRAPHVAVFPSRISFAHAPWHVSCVSRPPNIPRRLSPLRLLPPVHTRRDHNATYEAHSEERHVGVPHASPLSLLLNGWGAFQPSSTTSPSSNRFQPRAHPPKKLQSRMG